MIISGHRVVVTCNWCQETSAVILRCTEASCFEELEKRGWSFDAGNSDMAFCCDVHAALMSEEERRQA